MLFFFAITGLLLSSILLYFNAKRYPNSRYLGAFFFLLSLYDLLQYVNLYSKSVFFVSICYINFTFLTYLIGPMVYGYVRGVLTDNYRIRKWDFLHLLPALIFLISSLPYTFTSFSNKLEVASRIVADPGYIGIYSATLLNKLVPSLYIYMSRPVMIFIYVIWSTIIFIKYLGWNKRSSVFSHQRYMTVWLSLFIGFLFIWIMGQIHLISYTFINKDTGIFFSVNLLQILSNSGLAGLLISPFFFPAILYGMPRVPETVQAAKAPEITELYIYNEKKRNSTFYESDYLKIIDQKTEMCMRELNPYLQKDFNLTSLSVLIHIPVHHLAYYFREEKKQTFIEYRNKFRVEYSKGLIRDGKAKGLTLEAIGLLSGFITRNTFFVAFKNSEGMSPREYASQVHKTD